MRRSLYLGDTVYEVIGVVRKGRGKSRILKFLFLRKKLLAQFINADDERCYSEYETEAQERYLKRTSLLFENVSSEKCPHAFFWEIRR